MSQSKKDSLSTRLHVRYLAISLRGKGLDKRDNANRVRSFDPRTTNTSYRVLVLTIWNPPRSICGARCILTHSCFTLVELGWVLLVYAWCRWDTVETYLFRKTLAGVGYMRGTRERMGIKL